MGGVHHNASTPTTGAYNAAMLDFLIIAGAAIVLGLAGYAAWLWRRVLARRRALAAQHRAARADQSQSIRLITSALLQDDLNLTEAAIRLKVLIDNRLPPGEGQYHYPAIYGLHDATEHMPRRLARRQRPRAEIERLDAERQLLEAQYRERVVAEARALAKRFGETSLAA